MATTKRRTTAKRQHRCYKRRTTGRNHRYHGAYHLKRRTTREQQPSKKS